MKVEIVVDLSRIPPAPLSTGVAPANKQAAPARNLVYIQRLIYTETAPYGHFGNPSSNS
ncbi:hypothetical protein PCANC_14092 [Puccinia coronata f. sp. avenae]|uniref:Uncharacterized protein n=1 Tax=Puccinia coronata f. sp. avenae TaxID=200324 RepID=A0A2N5VRS9_9BASI|nr:hypothetical protein PCANC_14092 [Puccinia coronata f. sp. avenae]